MHFILLAFYVWGFRKFRRMEVRNGNLMVDSYIVCKADHNVEIDCQECNGTFIMTLHANGKIYTYHVPHSTVCRVTRKSEFSNSSLFVRLHN